MRTINWRDRLLGSTLLGAAAFTVLAGAPATAFAQNDQASELEEVIVTGSRIRARDGTSNSPIHTITGEALTEIGTATIETYMNALPQMSPSVTKTNNNPVGGGAAFLDLRDQGSARTLVLLDGRRVVPGSSNGATNISVLPSALIDRVEVITGGASAVYGADAVAGVVNFILKHDFNGGLATAQYGMSQEGDGAELQLNMLIGGDFADGRGHLTFAAGYTDRDLIMQDARAFSQSARDCRTDGCMLNGSSNTGAGTFNVTAAMVPHLQAYFGGKGVPANAIFTNQRIGFNPNGSLFVAGTGNNQNANDHVWEYKGPTEAANNFDPQRAYLHNFNPDNMIQSPFERYNLYTDFRYDLSDSIQFYGNALYSTYSAYNQLAHSPATVTIPVAGTPALAGTDAQAIMQAAGVTSFTLSRRTLELGARQQIFDTSALQLTAGLRGQLPEVLGKKWDYDMFASYGRYDEAQDYAGYPHLTRWNSALAGCPAGSPTGPVGPAGSPTSCVTLNPFGEGKISNAARDYVLATGQTRNTAIEQRNVVAAISGELIDLPAGPLAMALGAEYRDIEYSDVPPEGLQAGLLLGANAAGPVHGGYDVAEAFAEVKVPILRDLPLVHSAAIDGAYRRSDYSLGFETETWKYGGEYAPSDWARFRFQKQQAVRAPSVGELFSTRAEGYPNVGTATDPCNYNSSARTGANATAVATLCSAQAAVIGTNSTWLSQGTQYRTFSGGNVGLAPETAETLTYGVVLTAPDFFPDRLRSLNVSLDFWKIDIEQVISSVGFSTSLARCYDAAYNPTFSANNQYCANIFRDASTGFLTSSGIAGYISQTNANLAARTAEGWDFAAQYHIDLEDLGLSERLGRLALSTIGTRFKNEQFQTLPGNPWGDNQVGTIGNGTPGNGTLPKWKVTSRLTWTMDDVKVGLRHVYIGKSTDPGATPTNKAIPGVDAVHYFHLNGSWQATGNVELFGGVDNLFDKQPPIYTNGFQYATDPGTYDVIGRYFYVGARARF